MASHAMVSVLPFIFTITPGPATSFPSHVMVGGGGSFKNNAWITDDPKPVGSILLSLLFQISMSALKRLPGVHRSASTRLVPIDVGAIRDIV